MARTVACTNCGETVALPEAFDRPKIRCPGCGSYAPVPPDQRGAVAAVEVPAVRPAAKAGAPRVAKLAPPAVVAKPAPVPATSSAGVRPRGNPRDSRPEFTPDASGGQPMLVGSRDEDDDRPYGVPGTGLMPCPHCRQELPLDATFCVHCGKTLVGGERAERVHQPMAAVWEEGLPLRARWSIIAGLQVMNVVIVVLGALVQGADLRFVSTWVTLAVLNLVHVALQFFLVGSFDTLSVSRTARGKATVTRQRRIGFLKLAPEKIPLRDSNSLRVAGSSQPGLVEWFTFVYLFSMGCLPGIAFYFVVLHPERFQIDFTDELGVTRDTVYRTPSRDDAVAVCHFVQDATGLHYREV